jgi:hypothetical protein
LAKEQQQEDGKFGQPPSSTVVGKITNNGEDKQHLDSEDVDHIHAAAEAGKAFGISEKTVRNNEKIFKKAAPETIEAMRTRNCSTSLLGESKKSSTFLDKGIMTLRQIFMAEFGRFKNL